MARGGGMKKSKYMARGGGMKKSKYMAKGGAAAKAERKALGVSNMPASVMKALGIKGMRMGGPVPLQPGSGSPIRIGGNGPRGPSGPNIGGIPMRGRPLTPPKPVMGSRGPGGAMRLKKGGALGKLGKVVKKELAKKKSKYMSRGGGLYGK